MNKKLFKGVYSAIFSAYDEKMNAKKDTMHKLVDFQTKNGIAGFYVGGNTGECSILPNKTRMDVLEAVMEENKSGKIIAHIGAGHFDDTCQLLEHANSCNVDAVASLPPSLTGYYNDEEALEYYKYLAKHSNSPVIAYITSVYRGNIVELAKKLSAVENIIGIKLTIPDYFVHERINTICGDLNILNGPDECLLCGLITGADGGIGTSYNIAPKTVSNLYKEFIQGNISKAYENQHELNNLIAKIQSTGSGMVYWKAFMAARGFDMGYTAFPASTIPKEKIEEIQKYMDENPQL